MRACGSTDTTIARDWGWIFGVAPLSNTLTVPSACIVASCWNAVAAPFSGLTSLRLPPTRSPTWPVVVFSSYSAEVLRAVLALSVNQDIRTTNCSQRELELLKLLSVFVSL